MDSKRNGTVYLVGAGPGDPGLLTVKGRQVLAEADTVIYDALVGDGILGWIPETARQINVGKRSGRHSKPQEEINRILVEETGKGGITVRLKGGDPFVFGRGGEEAEILRENAIPYEIVPGVTSAAAVPAYFGIPVTHRGMASSFHVLTGHRENGQEVNIDYEGLVRAGGTDIFLMGVSAAETICRKLIEAGYPKETPAAFLQEGTTADQKKVLSTLEHLAEDGKRAGISAPALLVVGEVCSLSAAGGWAQKRPLDGIRILVTRPRTRSEKLVRDLRMSGAEVIELPVIDIRRTDDRERLQEVFKQIECYQWLVFTSPSGAELFFKELAERKWDLRRLNSQKIAVIGPATGAVFCERGIYPDYMPDCYYAAELGRGLGSVVKQEERLLLLRAEKGSEELTRNLADAGLSFDDIPLYQTLVPEASALTERVQKRLSERNIDFVTFTSSSTVKGFLELLKPAAEELHSVTAVCIGEKTEETARLAGFHTVTAEIPSMQSIQACIRRLVRNRGE